MSTEVPPSAVRCYILSLEKLCSLFSNICDLKLLGDLIFMSCEMVVDMKMKGEVSVVLVALQIF